MIVDTSALVAVIFGEEHAESILDALAATPEPRISAVSLLEVSIVVDAQHDPILSRFLDDFLTVANLAVEPVTAEHAAIARAAYRDFGRVSGHPAKLNYGDCFSYALAKTSDAPLLFVGDDFTHTDLRAAID